MATCHDMKTGEIYTCAQCGMELQVVTPCGESCSCTTPFSCCGEPMTVKA